MSNIIKPNDMFAAVMQVPDANVYDLVNSNILLDNTQLLDKDFYKTSKLVQETFKTEDGKFDDILFENTYNRALSLYNDLSEDQIIANTLEWDPYDFTAPVGSRKYNVTATISKDFNPYKNLYSRESIGSITPSKLSLREIAQQGKIFDTETKTWSEKSLNDISLFDKFFGDTLVYAQWDEDTQEVDELTGRIVQHKKGDWKFDSDGNLFIEKLGNREIHGKQIVNPMDVITTDGSAFNKVDFFDSDGKTKSIVGTASKLIVEIAPFLIPQTAAIYGAYKAAKGLAFVLPTFYKAIEGIFLGDESIGNETEMWKAMNSMQGYLAKWNQNSVSDEAAASFFNSEQIANLVSDVYSQLYEQRAMASLSKLFYKSNEKEYLEKLTEGAKKQLEQIGIIDTAFKIERTDAAYGKIGQAAAKKISDLNNWEKKRSALAKSLSLSYMAMTQSSQVYTDALDGGYDRRTAGAAALISAAGQFALMYNNPLGDWFLDKSVGYTSEKASFSKAFNKIVKDKFPKIQEDLSKLENKTASRINLGKTFSEIKNKFTEFIDSANTATTFGKNVATNAVIEGIEEVSEQAVMDMTKGVVDLFSSLGFTGKQGSFGGFSNVFSQQGLENYLANFVGGMIGGGIFEAQRSIPMILKGEDISKEINYEVTDIISNGKKKEFLEHVKKESNKLGSNSLGMVSATVDGRQLYLPAEQNTQAAFIYATIENYVNGIENILNSEKVNENDESWVRKAIIDEIRIQDITNSGTDSFIISDVRELLNKVVNLKSVIEELDKSSQDSSTKKSELEEALKELEEIQTGKKSDYYYGLSLFALNKNLHKTFISMDVRDYVKDKYKKDFNILSPKEQQDYISELEVIMSEDLKFKDRMKSMYSEFMKYNELFSKSFEDYGKEGYDEIRSKVFKELIKNKDLIQNAVENNDFATLKNVWAFIQMTNTLNAQEGRQNVDLNSSITTKIGNMLLKSGTVKLLKSKKELSELMNVPVEEVDSYYAANLILERISRVFPDLTIEELQEKASTMMTADDVQILNQSFFSNPEIQNKKVSEIVNPEIFKSVDYNNLSEEEQLKLASLLDISLSNSEVTSLQNIQLVLQEINNINSANIQSLDSTKEDEALTKEDLANLNLFAIDTKDVWIDTPLFVNANLENFYNPVIEAFANSGIEGMNESVSMLKAEGASNKQILAFLLGANESGGFNFDITLEKLKEIFPEVDVYTIPAFNELAYRLNGELENISEETSPEMERSIIQSLFQQIIENDINIILETGQKLTGGFFEDTRTTAENTVAIPSEFIPWTNNARIANSNDDIYLAIVPAAIIEFTKPFMEAGQAIDAEIIEAAKEELRKLQKHLNDSKYNLSSLEKELKELIDYGNIKRNSFLDILRGIQLNIFKEGSATVTIFDLLKELNVDFSKDVSPNTFKISPDYTTLIKKGKYTLEAAKAIMTAMLTTKDVMELDTFITEHTLYGYNNQFNKMYNKEGKQIQLGMLSSEDTKMLSKEIDLLSSKIKHFEMLSENNQGSTIQEQKQIGDALNDALLRRLKSKDAFTLLKQINGRFLLSEDDLKQVASKPAEEQVYFLENRIRENFIEMVNEGSMSMTEVLDEIFEPFKKSDVKDNQYSFLDNSDSILLPLMKEVSIKDWYNHLHAILAMSSIDFLELYKKYLEKEVSLSDNFRAPFITQRLLMQESAAYLNGEVGKEIMSHSVDFLVSKIEEHESVLEFKEPEVNPKMTAEEVKKLKEAAAKEFEDEFLKRMESISGFNISNIFFTRGTGGTGKSDVIANFITWLATKQKESLGSATSVIALAPTEKTRKVLEKGINRDKITETTVEGKTLEDYLSTLLKGTNYSKIREAIVKADPKINGEIKDSDGNGTGVFVKSEQFLLSEEALELMLGNIENETPQILIIDEASKINTLQYQVLDYLARKKNYFIEVLGDDLQEGIKLGKFNSDISNIFTFRSVKLKSTIRSENNLVSNNVVTLENYSERFRRGTLMQNYSSFKENNKLVLEYSVKNNLLFGHKFIDTLSLEDLKEFDAAKELLIITEDGTISESIKDLLTKAFGTDYSKFVTVSTPEVQGEEFAQVIILSGINKENLALTIKSINTLFGRAKLRTLIVGETTSRSDGLKTLKTAKNNLDLEIVIDQQYKDVSIPKELDIKEMRQFLEETDKYIGELLKALGNKSSNEIKVVEKEEEKKEEKEEKPSKPTPEEPSNIPPLPELFPLEKSDNNPSNQNEEIDKEGEKDIESDNNSNESREQTIQIENKKGDLKIISYTNHVNLGKDLPNLSSAEELRDWINNLSEDSTDFAKIVFVLKEKYEQLDDEDLINIFEEDLNTFLKDRNKIIGLIERSANLPSTSGIVSVSLLGQDTNIDISNAYIVSKERENYSEPYGNRPKGKLKRYGAEYKPFIGLNHFLTIDIPFGITTIPISISPLSLKETAINKDKNLYGDVDKLTKIYDAHFKLGKTVPFNLIGNFKRYTGVQSLTVENNSDVKITATQESIEKNFKGASVESYGTFRGPSYNQDMKLDEATVENFMINLELYLNTYNQTPIKIIDKNKYPKNHILPKGYEYYQKYMFRPYVVLSYYDGDTQYKKIQLLYSKKRSISEFWQELNEKAAKIQTIEDPAERDDNLKSIGGLISKYQSWNLLGEFINSILGVGDQIQKENYEKFMDWFADIYNLRVIEAKDINAEHLKVTTIKEALSAWDFKESFEKFFSTNKKVQELVRNITKLDENPIYSINMHINGVVESDINPITEKFLDFIQNSKTKVYYNTRIISRRLDTPLGQVFGDFDKNDAKNYDLRYYTEFPQMLLDLGGLDNNLTVNKPSAPVRTTSEKGIKGYTFELNYKAPTEIGNDFLNRFIKETQNFTKDLSEYQNILNAINANKSEYVKLGKTLGVLIDGSITSIVQEILPEITNDLESVEFALDEIIKELKIEINKMLTSVNNSVQNNKLDINTTNENKHCKF